MTKEKLEKKNRRKKKFRILMIFIDSQEVFCFEKLKLMINNC